MSSNSTPQQHEFNPHFLEQQQPRQQQQRQDHDHHQPHSGLKVPQPRRTNPITWFAAIFCAIFWIIVILGGLVVLIVYLIFRPRNPHFDVSSATLNAAYIDMGYLLNADLTVLANFTNPNKKIDVDFSYMDIDLYYGDTLIATGAIDPFSATRTESKLQDVHMVSSQVRLPSGDSERLQKQMEGNGIILDVKGTFRTRSNFGSIFHYSYWLYSRCTIVLTGPPSGVLVGRNCRTKR
ncbi:PREDICTED: NDR1/HIN1-Like protein 3 [Nelumbo nucifera]|uniref:Late embryogenesis abundant protein LEA-2 subgroup domain-containing protein n=2 Tax=Nelumbo nucifera TaxID=4432 RepID=A0A822YPH0_NELNU|nr:PREDICTED: NDR1/HIN1-Like protein 3 [Nelumbo nucifera]DAD34417.1 TPA_asm: hypothetical protein HUJ06_005057 [Nelumbo nucifera]